MADSKRLGKPWSELRDELYAEDPGMENYYIGWDVGGWHCKRSSKCADAIVILDNSLSIVGTPWRGNLRETINLAESSKGWKTELFSLCEVNLLGSAHITLAIDAPLGFSDEFCRLVNNFQCLEMIGEFRENPYLFRQTERFLHWNGLKPLSAVQDQIGSQATKGMHVLAKFAPERISCGVWSDGGGLTAIEAYPSACKESDTIQKLAREYSDLGHQDKNDALVCALVAYLFAEKMETLKVPPSEIPECEGWIWVPKDGLGQESYKKLWQYCTSNNRMVPSPTKWDAVYKLLPNKKQLPSGGYEPPLPLILGAWHDSSALDKHYRFKAHIEWARDHGALIPVGNLLRSLDEEDWVYWEKD